MRISEVIRAHPVFRVGVTIMLLGWLVIGLVGERRSHAATYQTVALPMVANGYVGQSASRIGIWIGGGDDTTINLLAGTGARWTRVVMNWSQIEPTHDGDYHFAGYDGLLRSLRQRGITPIVEIRGNPTWAATTTCGPIDQAGGLSAFSAFVSAVAARYSQSEYGVHYWEIYNEPDNTDVASATQVGLGCWGNHVAEYSDTLQAAQSAIYAADGAGKVVLGGLAYDCYPTCANNIFNMDFLDQLLAQGGGTFFDIANLHYFSSHNARWSANGWDVAGKVTSLRNVMANRGVSKPVAVTEASWTTGNDLELQARYVPKVLARGRALDLHVMTWFSLIEINDNPIGAQFGLTDMSGNKRPSYTAFQIATREFGESTAVRRLRASEVGASATVEGYAFSVGGRERWVLWARADGANDGGTSRVDITIPSTATAAYGKLGSTITLSACGTRLSLTDDPIYVRY